MHSRIFILRNNDNNDYYEIPTEDELFENRPEYIIDYISPMTNLDDDIEWLKNSLPDSVEIKDHRLTMNEEQLKEVVDKRFNYIKELAAKVADVSEEEFIKSSYCLYDLQDALAGNTLSFYIYDCEDGFMDTLQNYILRKLNYGGKIDKKIVASYDYHY